MTQALNTCMILAAGFGKRLLPFTNDIPKPLIEVLGKPLLDYHLDSLIEAGVNNVVINAHHHANQIIKHVLEYNDKLSITVSSEKEILGTGGGIQRVRPKLQHTDVGPILLIQGDVLIDLDIRQFHDFHRSKNGIASLVLKHVDDFEGYGSVGDLDDRILKLSNWVEYHGTSRLRERFFCGVHMLSPHIFEYFPHREKFCITSELYPELIKRDVPIYGYSYDSIYCDVGTPYRLWKVSMDLLSNRMKFLINKPFERFIIRDSDVFLGNDTEIAQSARIIGPVVIDDNAIVNEGATVGPNVVLGKRSIIEKGARITNSVVLSDAKLVRDQQVSNVILSLKNMEKIHEDV